MTSPNIESRAYTWGKRLFAASIGALVGGAAYKLGLGDYAAQHAAAARGATLVVGGCFPCAWTY